MPAHSNCTALERVCGRLVRPGADSWGGVLSILIFVTLVGDRHHPFGCCETTLA